VGGGGDGGGGGGGGFVQFAQVLLISVMQTLVVWIGG